MPTSVEVTVLDEIRELGIKLMALADEAFDAGKIDSWQQDNLRDKGSRLHDGIQRVLAQK